MEQANNIKAIFTAVFAFLSALLGVLAVPVILLVACKRACHHNKLSLVN